MTAMDTTFRTAPGGPPTLRKLVVIGNGMAGARTVEEILARDGAEQFAITMFGVTTPGVLRLQERLGQAGVDTLTFHAVGSGGRAMEEMIELSGQSKAPTMNWDGEILADFGVDELVPFLRKKGDV